jgi:Acetyltransferases
MDIVVKQLETQDILLLEQTIRREPFRHYERFLSQRSGILIYLIAWQNGLPIGSVMLRWKGKSLPTLEQRYPGCPHLIDLYVVSAYRSCGVGTRLLEAAEAAARQRGYTHIGLSVALENRRARSLYTRRGYQDAGLDSYYISWTEIDGEGKAHEIDEECIYLVREL